MEKNANPHRDHGGSSPCSTITGEFGGTKATEVVKGAADSGASGEPSALSTSVSSSASASSPLSTSAANAVTGETEPGVGLDIVGPLPVQNFTDKPGNCSGTSSSELRDQLSNGMDSHSLLLAPGNGEGASSSKLVNNRADGDPPSTARITNVHAGAVKSASQEEPAKMSPPTSLCPKKTTLKSAKPGGLDCSYNSNAVSAGGAPPAESDPLSPAAAGEPRSFDSSESFSNLNSCPSSDLNSEGMEDRVLAIALQSDEYGADEAKVSCSKEKDRGGAGQSIYHIKWIKWKEENTPIITQNENGPCPLLAIMNVLLLAWKVKMPPMMEIITAEQLMEYLGDYILDAKPKEISEAQRLNYEQNMSDAIVVLHKLQTGLDVNVRFTGVRVFEYTPECIVFDLLDIPLYHGWLVDPQMDDIVRAVGNCSYNQLVEKIISCKQSESSQLAGEGYVAELFLHSTATQLTLHGLCELTSSVQEGELCVFFRNNHFSTMTKFKGQLYLLVTDQGFLTEEKVVWESLHNVDGDGDFCDSEFRLRPPSDPETVYRGQQDQIEQDYLMALSLQQEQQGVELSWEQAPEGAGDLELAKKLQEEEDRRASQFYQEQEQAAAAAQQAQEQQQPAGGDAEAGAAAAAAAAAKTAGAAAATPSPGKQPSAGERKLKKEVKDKDKCVLL